MKIVFFGLEKNDQDVFVGAFPDAEVSFFEEKLDESNVALAKDAEIISVFVNCTINREVIDSLPNLKFIATRSTGFDHLDCEYANTKGIKVSNVPSYGSRTVAEFALGLILNLSRNIIKANNHIKETLDFNYDSQMQGFDLQGKILGVIGTGKIGKNVIKTAKALAMEVIAYDLYPDMSFALENKFIYKSFKDVLMEADILTLHTPYTKENHHLINQENISIMKRGVYLINTARGELVDTEALVSGLKEGILAGAGLDVLENERQLKDEKNFLASGKATEEEKKLIDLNHQLMKMPNVIVTPHVAFYTNEAVIEILHTSLENIKGFMSGNPINLVN